MGIPVVDLGATYSSASMHPVLTGLVILALIALGAFMFWLSRKIPKHMGKVRLGMLAVYLVLGIAFSWEAFKPQPSPFSQVLEAVQKAQQSAEELEP
jgi:hypothetical protein